MTDIIDTARAVLAEEHDATNADIAALCRSLIERTEALRQLLDAEDALDADRTGGACDTYKAAYHAARGVLNTHSKAPESMHDGTDVHSAALELGE